MNSVTKASFNRFVFMVILLTVPTAISAEKLVAFPGAEGFGAYTPGGRGGKVLLVTNLQDSGPGSLRAAIETPGPRIIVFRTGGTIKLQSHLKITEPYVTIAGQSAPGGGILLRDAGLYISTHDVIVRFLRVRIGASTVEKYDTQDCLHIGDGEGVYNVIVDHLSLSWSIDEVGGAVSRAHDITIQWSIFAEPLNEPLKLHKKREHAYCMMLGNYPNHVSVHHNLLAHSEHRNPRIQGGTHDFVNNVIYNWGYFTGVFSRFPNVNFVGNFYKAGPESRFCPPIVEKEEDMGKIYVSGNLSPHRPTDGLIEWQLTVNAPADSHQVGEPFPVAPVTTTDANTAYKDVLAKAGARLPELDEVDQRILSDIVQGTGRIINHPKDVGGFPFIDSGKPLTDSDSDGMPDNWEVSNSLDPFDATDAQRDANGNGYSNIEDYLNELAEL